MKFRELSAQVIDHELVHSTLGPTGIKVRLAGPQDTLVREKMLLAEEAKKKGFKEQKKAVEDVMVAIIRGWDEVQMELAFTPENVRDVVSQTENEWLVEDVMKIVQDKANFFRKQN